MTSFAPPDEFDEPDAGLSCAPAGGGSHRAPVQGQGQAILVASGSSETRILLSELLTRQGYSVTVVDNGEEALQRLKAARFDLLIASVAMPRVDGLELLRSLAGSKNSPPVIALAAGHGKIDQVYVKCADLLGAAGTYMQPLRPKSFLSGVAEILKTHSMRIVK